jgi:hypothetical protein
MINNAPQFENEFLQKVVDSFHARSRSIKHNTQGITLEKEIDDSAERLNIDVDSYATPPYQTRLSLWGDRYAYFRTCQSSKVGWKHIIELNGILDTCDVSEIEKRFEKSIRINTLKDKIVDTQDKIVDTHRLKHENQPINYRYPGNTT